MIDSVILEVEVHHYWRQGTGKASGAHLDALVDRNERGMPFVAGRMLKGLLRDAVNRLEGWGQLDFVGMTDTGTEDDQSTIVRALFGTSGRQEGAQGPTPRTMSKPGLLRVNDARLPLIVEDYLVTADDGGLKQALYRNLHSTAIAFDTGVAKAHSLRAMEVCIPMTLASEISVIREPNPEEALVLEHWTEILRHGASLIPAVGSNRTRGLGRSTLRVVEAS